jgi:hypothetical protein
MPMRRGLVLIAALVITGVIALNAWVLSDADEAAWAREASSICADASAESQAILESAGEPSSAAEPSSSGVTVFSPEVITTVFGRSRDVDGRAFNRIAALEAPEARADEIARFLTLWRRHRDADDEAFADLGAKWSEERLRRWMDVTYPLSADLEHTARALGSERCGDYFSPDPV